MKKVVLLFVILISVGSLAQSNRKLEDASVKDYNLPPGAILRPKFSFIDLSYKIEKKSGDVYYTQEDLTVLNTYSQKELELMKIHIPNEYKYYMELKAYMDALSDRVKKIYSVNELNYIYVFDQKLKNKLLTLK